MLSNGEMLFTVCADYEKYQRQISVLVITNLIDARPKLSSLFDELHLDELKAVEGRSRCSCGWFREIFTFYNLPLDNHYSLEYIYTGCDRN